MNLRRGKTAGGYLRDILNTSVIPRIKLVADSAKLVLGVFKGGAGIQRLSTKLDSRSDRE